MKTGRIIALLMVFLPLCASAAARHYDANPPMGISTGPKTGTYIAFGRDIARVAQQEGLTVNVYDSNGSIENIKRITSKDKVGLAIVQSDVLGFLSRSHTAGSVDAARKLRLVVPFYSEEVHILARSSINSLADLAGKRVVVGSSGSGSMMTAVNIFSTLNVLPAKLYEIDSPRGVVAVLNNEADAIVFVGGKPVKMFKNMEDLASITQGPNAGKLSQIHFLPLNDPRLLKEYKPATITHNDYNFVTADVPTVAVTALLVTYDYTLKNEPYYHLQCANNQRLVKALRDHMADLRANGHPKWKEVNLDTDVAYWKRDSCSDVSGGVRESNPQDKTLENDLIGVIRGRSQ